MIIFLKLNYHKKMQIIKSSSQNANSAKKTWNIDVSEDKWSFFQGLKMENLQLFKTFFLILKLDINKCPKWILKKKFAKMKTTFFSTFFSDIFFAVSYDEWCNDFLLKVRRDHKKKSEKIGFFPYFSDFFGIFWDRLDNFWTTLDNFWTTL